MNTLKRLWYRLRGGYYDWLEWCECYSLKQRLHYKVMQFKSFFQWLFRKIDWWTLWDGNYFQLDCCVNCVKLCPECGECEGAHLEFDYKHTGFGCPHKGKTTLDEARKLKVTEPTIEHFDILPLKGAD